MKEEAQLVSKTLSGRYRVHALNASRQSMHATTLQVESFTVNDLSPLRKAFSRARRGR